MSGANRRGPRQGAPRARNSRSMKDFVTKSEIKGMKVTPSTNPPDTTIQPWYPYVIVDTFHGSFNYKVGDLAKYLRKMMDPNGWGFNPSDTGAKPFRVQFRLQSVYVWNLSGKFITLSVEDFHDTQSAKGGRDQLCGLIDSGTQNHTPAIGYKLPLSCRNTVLRNDDQETGIYVFHSQAADGDVCLVHAHVLWRFDGPVLPPANSAVTLHDLNENIRILSQTAESLKEISEQNRKEKPSTISKIIGGVSQLALLVSTVAGEEDSFSLLSNPDPLDRGFE